MPVEVGQILGAVVPALVTALLDLYRQRRTAERPRRYRRRSRRL